MILIVILTFGKAIQSINTSGKAVAQLLYESSDIILVTPLRLIKTYLPDLMLG